MNDIAKSLYWENTGIDWMIIEDNATIILTTGNRTIFTTTDSISKHVSDLKLQDYSYYITIRNNACSVSDIVNEQLLIQMWLVILVLKVISLIHVHKILSMYSCEAFLY